MTEQPNDAPKPRRSRTPRTSTRSQGKTPRRTVIAQPKAATGRGVAQSATVIVRPIEGEVAAILNELQLAINRGRRHGVTYGMRFEVLDQKGVKITDPETSQKLGEEVPIKIRIRIVRAEENYSIGESDERTGGSGLFALSSYLVSTSPRRRTLRTEEALFPPLTEEASYVKRGDRVRQIIEGSPTS